MCEDAGLVGLSELGGVFCVVRACWFVVFPVFRLALARTIFYGFTPRADFERRFASSSCTFEIAAFVAESFWPAWSSRDYSEIWEA